MSSLRHSIPALATIAGLLAATMAFALETPSDEMWEQIALDGRTVEIEQNMLRLNDEARGTEPTVAEIVTGIGRDYGLPTQKFSRTDKTGSSALNLDMNEVIDERDILPLGFANTEKETSTTVAWGTTGNFRPNILVLLIKFPDQEPTDLKNGGDTDVNHDTDWAEDRWTDSTAPGNLEDGSVAYYYTQCSYGKLDLTGDVYNDTDFSSSICDSDGWITSAYDRADIDHGNTWPEVVQDAVQQVDPYVDFSDYDSNGDGYVDGLVTIYAGEDDYGSSFWHFRWSGYVSYTTDGVRLRNGVWTSEEGYYRTWCHEFGHELGLPDFYDVGGSSSGDDMPGMGYWGLMGSWTTNTGKIPPYPCALSRVHLGFVDPVEVGTKTSGTSFTINRATSATNTDTILRLWRNSAVGKEFFLVEYRDTDDDTMNFDQKLPGSGGLLIWHVDEDRTTGNNHDNAFDPQRVWLECPDDPGDPTNGNNTWRSGYNGVDGVDYFDDTTTPNAKDNDGNNSEVFIDPTGSPGGASMGLTYKTGDTTGVPTLSWDAPGSGATVSGNQLIDVTSNADDRVEYYVDGCLKHIESGPGPYSGFTWDTTTARDDTVQLIAMAYNSTGDDPVWVKRRSVTVNNGNYTGQSMIWQDDFDTYTDDEDNDLLGLWNLHEDAMGLDIQIVSAPAYDPDPGTNNSGKSIAFAQSSFPDPPSNSNNEDPNAGVYTSQDDEWLMTPRIGLYGYSDLELSFRLCFRLASWGDAVLACQISDDDGATWDDLAHYTYGFSSTSDPDFTGWWRDDPVAQTNYWKRKIIDLDDYVNEDVYIRFKYHGGRSYNVGMAVDDFRISGTSLPLALNSVSPSRVVIGDSLTLNGAGFHATQGSGEVRFNDGSGGYVTATTITSWTNTQIVCDVPTGAVSHATDGVWVYQDFITTGTKPLSVVLGAPSIDDLDQL